jgi:ribonuclease E
MTRKRVGAGLLEAFSVPCECCNGRGVHVSLDLADLAQPGEPVPGHSRGRSHDSKPNGNGSGNGRKGRNGESRRQSDESNVANGSVPLPSPAPQEPAPQEPAPQEPAPQEEVTGP